MSQELYRLAPDSPSRSSLDRPGYDSCAKVAGFKSRLNYTVLSIQILRVANVFGNWWFLLIDCITSRLGVRTLQGQIRLQSDHIHKLILDSESQKLKTPKLKKPLIDFKMVQWSQFWIALKYRWKKYWSTLCISLVVGVVLYTKSTATVVSTYIINSFLRQFLFRSFWLIF